MNLDVIANKTDSVTVVILFIFVVSLAGAFFWFVKKLDKNEQKHIDIQHDMVKNQQVHIEELQKENRADRELYQKNIAEITEGYRNSVSESTQALANNTQALFDMLKNTEVIPIMQNQLCKIELDIKELKSK